MAPGSREWASRRIYGEGLALSVSVREVPLLLCSSATCCRMRTLVRLHVEGESDNSHRAGNEVVDVSQAKSPS
jgi:hypothetical protein